MRMPYAFMCWILLLFASTFSPRAQSAAEANRERVRQEESLSYYQKWLEEDVTYIITDQERSVFETLSTDAERDAFIEQFWLRRDTDPRTAENEYKVEHYRRIAYANENFSIGLPGWKSDRGRVYIINGPPDGIETHDQGEQYYRPTSEGGGVTTTYAWQVWYYRNIEGLGESVEVEFVDRRMTGDFRFAWDDMDRDAMLWTPGVGLTESERLGGSTKAERIGTRTMANVATRRGGNPLKVFTRNDDLFERMHKYTELQAPPDIKYKDLEAISDVRIYFNNLPFSVRYDRIRITDEDFLVPVTLFFDVDQFTFERKGDFRQVELNVYGRVETLTKRHVYSFDDSVALRVGPDSQGAAGDSVYQRAVPLKPGRYKLVVIVQEKAGGKIGTVSEGIVIPEGTPGQLELSPIILADLVRPAANEEFLSNPFVLGTVKVYPSPQNQFVQGKPLGFYFEVYNVGADQQTLEPSLSLDLEIRKGDQEIPLPFKDLHRLFHRYSDRFFAGSMLNTAALQPGDYSLTIRVTDNIMQTSDQQTVQFSVEQGRPDGD